MLFYRIFLNFFHRQKLIHCQRQSNEPPGNRCCPGSSVGLNYITVHTQGNVFHFGQINHRTQRTPDKALNFLCPAGRLFQFTGNSDLRCPRQHTILGSNPAPVLPPQPGRNFFFHAHGANHMRVAALNQTGTLGIRIKIRNNLNLTDFIIFTSGMSHHYLSFQL